MTSQENTPSTFLQEWGQNQVLVPQTMRFPSIRLPRAKIRRARERTARSAERCNQTEELAYVDPLFRSGNTVQQDGTAYESPLW
jgi:hypothetical protein